MKTKTRKQFKTLIAFATILCCIISLNLFAQSPIVPTQQDFMGTWKGTIAAGQHIEIILTSDWKCNFTTDNNAPMFADNQVVAYRMPQFFPRTIAENGAPTSPEITIKFYTQNAMAGVRVAASVPSTSSSAGNNSVITNTIEQIYTGLAVLSLSASGQMEMALYLDAANYSEVPPAQIPTPDMVPYCVLVRQ